MKKKQKKKEKEKPIFQLSFSQFGDKTVVLGKAKKGVSKMEIALMVVELDAMKNKLLKKYFMGNEI